MMFNDNTAVLTTNFVIKDKKVITTVCHDKDGQWSFFSNDEFENYLKAGMVVPFKNIVEIDISVLQVADLPQGYCARRNFKGDEWLIEKTPPCNSC